MHDCDTTGSEIFTGRSKDDVEVSLVYRIVAETETSNGKKLRTHKRYLSEVTVNSQESVESLLGTERVYTVERVCRAGRERERGSNGW